MKSPYCYLNGKIAPLNELSLPLNDLGVLRGYGIFDFMRTYYGKPFLMKEHLERFGRSAKKIGIPLPYSLAQIEAITRTLLKKNNFSDSIVKFVLTGGPSVDGITLSGKPTFYILTGEAHNPPETAYTHGVHLQTYEYQRLLPEIKSLNYIVSVQHQKELKRKGVLELLYVHDGKVLECSSSNVFIVKKQTLITPKNNILVGTTRNMLKKIVGKKYRIEERNVRISELKTADEVFVTAANKGVMPVTKIDGKNVGKGAVGPVVKDLMYLYGEFIKP